MKIEEGFITTITEFSKLLKEAGQFVDLEIKIILAILALENKHRIPISQFQFTADQIAKESDMSVTNAYKYLYSLQKKGFVESREDKNKLFWLARSSNPFPRIFSLVTKEYMNKRELFSKLEKNYDKLIKVGEKAFSGQKTYEEYTGDFSMRAAYILDLAKDEVLITTQKLFDDVIVLEAVKRAIERNVKIKIITQELHAEMIDKLNKIGIEIRLGRSYPYVILVDGMHGITDEAGKGTWFLNCKTHYKEKFEELWDKSDII